MPSNINPETIASGPGKIAADTVTAAAELYTAGSAAILTTLTDVLTQEVAKVTTQSFTSGASPGDLSRSLPSNAGPYYVDGSLSNLFKVVQNSDDTEIFNPATGLYVHVASINVPQSGYVSAVTVTFNTPIPPGLAYKIYYGRQYTLANLPSDFVTNPLIRRSAERARFPELPRSGLAPTSTSASQVYTAAYPDPILAQWKATLNGGTNATAYDETRGGAIGFAHIGSAPNVIDGTGNDVFKTNMAGAAFFAAYEKDIRSTTFTTTPSSTTYTKINSTLDASVSATSVTLNAVDYIRVGNNTSFRLGVDMLELTYADGVVMTVVPTTFNGSNVRILDNCKTLGGATTNLPVSASVKVKWIRPSFFVGNGHGKYSTEFQFVGMNVLSPGCITDQPNQEVEHVPPFYSAGTMLPTRAGVNSWNIKAFTWGAFTETGSAVADIGKKTIKGELRGDGSVSSFGGHVEGLLTARTLPALTAGTGNVNYVMDPFNGSFLFIDMPSILGTSVNLTLSSTYLADQKNGDQINILVRTYLSPRDINFRINWPSQFIFSGEDAKIGTYKLVESSDAVSNTAVSNYYKYSGVSYAGNFFMTRTDYEGLL